MSFADLMARALRDRRVAYVAPDLGRTLGLAPLLPGYLVVCRDAMGLGDRVPFPVEEVSAAEDSDDLRSSHELLSDEGAVRALRRHGITDLLLFKVNARLVARAAELGLRVLAGAPTVAQRFEHKVHFTEILADLGLPAPRTLVTGAVLPSFGEAVAALGVPFVAQGARGHSGQSTFLVATEDDYERFGAASRGRAARLCEWVDGTPLTVNGCVTGPGLVHVGRAYVQLTGLPEATPQLLGACGNAWEGGRAADSGLEEAAAAIGRALSRAGYLGIFGVDAIWHGADLRVIEVNPRMISGASMESLLQLSAATLPLAAAHVLAHLGETATLPGDTGRAAVTGGQLVLYNLAPKDTIVESSPLSGRFRLSSSGLDRLDDEVDPAACAPDEVILLARSQGRSVPAGGEYARVQTPRTLLCADRDAPSPFADELIAAAKRRVRLAATPQ